MATFKWKGFDKIQQKLGELTEDVAKKLTSDAMSECLEPMKNKAKDLAPKDTHTLERSIVITRPKSKNGYIFTCVRMGAKDFQGKVYYGAFQEYGYELNGVIYPGKHFLKKAFDATVEQCLDHSIEIIDDAIKDSLNP